MGGPRILVVADEYYASLAAVRALRAAGYEPWVASTTPDGYAQRSGCVAGVLMLPAPSEGSARFAAAVADAAESCGASVVLPGTESAMLALASRPAALAGIVVGAPDEATLARATDKESLARLAGEAGLSAPAAVRIDHGDPSVAIAALSFPAVVKPVRSAVAGHGGAHEVPNARTVATPAELTHHVRSRPDVSWLVQPLLEGSLIAVSGVTRAGEVVCTVHQRALRTFPRGCGVSAYAETVPRDERLDRGLRRLHAALGWTAMWEAQFLAGRDGAHLIDLNPRPYGSLALALAAGVNLPALWVEALRGGETHPADFLVGRRFRAEMRELGLLADAVRSHDLVAAASILLPRPRTTHAVLAWRDPRPSLLLLKRMVARSRG